MNNSRNLKTALILMGSFTFAFLLGETVHEWGHYLAHRYFGVPGISIHLDPFGGSRIMGVKALPMREMGITTAAGPGLDLLAGIVTTLLFWRFSSPVFTPLVLWGPVALIQEGVNLSLGLLSPGSDAQWLSEWGAPNLLLIILGVGFILAGMGLISRILYRSEVVREKPFAGRFVLVFFGLGFLMILRAVVSLFHSPGAALENLVPLVFALILAGVISGLLGVWKNGKEGDRFKFQLPSWADSSLAAGLGLGILLLQIVVH
jgi:hypothetical protein